MSIGSWSLKYELKVTFSGVKVFPQANLTNELLKDAFDSKRIIRLSLKQHAQISKQNHHMLSILDFILLKYN